MKLLFEGYKLLDPFIVLLLTVLLYNYLLPQKRCEQFCVCVCMLEPFQLYICKEEERVYVYLMKLIFLFSG